MGSWSLQVAAQPSAAQPSAAQPVAMEGQADAASQQVAEAAPDAALSAPLPTTAHAVVAQVSEQMLAVIARDKSLLATDPSAYFEQVNAVLEPAVAFPYIAKVVMAKHYQQASEQQRQQFAEVFQQTMVETIAKGMANYSESQMTVREPAASVAGKRKVEVLQDVKGSDGNHLVSYTMAKNKAGQWKLINVVLNGVNLGKSL